jgi:hypothetical protein
MADQGLGVGLICGFHATRAAPAVGDDQIGGRRGLLKADDSRRRYDARDGSASRIYVVWFVVGDNPVCWPPAALIAWGLA